MFPCVQFKGRRYTDGGVRSGTSADLATGHENVLIIAPIGAGTSGVDPLMGRQACEEADALSSRGANVELVFPDGDAMAIMGGNRMDGSKRAVMVDQGLRQGRELAARVSAAWSATVA